MEEQARVKLVEALAGGDEDALQRLIVEYHDVLCARVARGMDEVLLRRLDPEDILQEAYASAFRFFTTCHFGGPAQFYKWLEQVVQSKLLDAVRAAGRQKRDVRREVAARAIPDTTYHDLLDRTFRSLFW